MSHEFLQALWFILIAILWIGFFFLEGFDFGVGMLLPFLGKKDVERRAIINTIGPHWDGNEVWLLTAGGATFAAFPHWYATLFSGFYPAFFLLLVGLILRGVAFEFRSKDANPKWRSLWDWCIFAGSALPTLLLGVAFANFAKGVPIDAEMQYTGTLLTLLNPFGLLGGLTAIAIFLLHGSLFLSMKVEGQIAQHAKAFAQKAWGIALALTVLTLAAAFVYTDIGKHAVIILVPVAGLVALLLAGYFNKQKKTGWAFTMTGLTIALSVITTFLVMFPRVMISSTDPANSLTIYNASSSPYTLQVMSVVALVFVPIVLVYQIWTYRVFRQRVKADPKTLTY